MADEPENLTIRLLQEIRIEMREMRNDLTSRVDDLSIRVDGNAIILNMLAGMWHSQEKRISRLEANQKLG